MKRFEEVKADLQRLGVARFYYYAVRTMIFRMFNEGVLPKKEPKIEQGMQKQTGNKKWADFWDYHLFKQMLSDKQLIEAYLLEEEIVPEYGSKIEKGKEYITVKFYPKPA